MVRKLYRAKYFLANFPIYADQQTLGFTWVGAGWLTEFFNLGTDNIWDVRARGKSLKKHPTNTDTNRIRTQ